MNAVQRAQRQHDLLLAADVLRRQIDASLTTLAPTADRALRHWRWLSYLWLGWQLWKQWRR
jgi:hypothetical protein